MTLLSFGSFLVLVLMVEGDAESVAVVVVVVATILEGVVIRVVVGAVVTSPISNGDGRGTPATAPEA